ncbi:MAG: 30S ribosomal protein S4, partial [Planctomycetaceae bacterium]|nr:30S ribosomal protein S4 [Planctomycetaceae bacterium]
PGDIVTVRRRNNILKLYQGVTSLAEGEPVEWLASDTETLRITVQGNPGPSDISLPVDGNMVVEFLSR